MCDENTYKTLYRLPTYILVLILLCGGFLFRSCNEQARGFSLPEGDMEEGKIIYNKMACNECHSISDIAWQGGIDSLNISLGGEVSAQKSYGELVTSIINPSHKIAKRYKQNTTTVAGLSKMKNYNEVMTVQELIDIVAFLQSEYEIQPPPTPYSPYHY